MLQNGYLNFLFIYWKSSSDLPCSSVGVVFGCFSDIFTLNVIFWVFFWVQDLVLFCVSIVSYFGSFVMFVRFLFFLCHHHILQQSVCILRSSSLVESYLYLLFSLSVSRAVSLCRSGLCILRLYLCQAGVSVPTFCFFFFYSGVCSSSSILCLILLPLSCHQISPSWALACSLASRYPVCILLILSFLHFAHSFHKLSNKAAFYFIPHSRVLPAKMFHDIKM